MKSILIAHRGEPASWPENSYQGFEAVLRAGVRYIETDVQMTADGVAVLSHDPTLLRITGHDLVVTDTAPPNSRRSLDLRSASRAKQIGMQIPPQQATSEYAGLAVFSKKGFKLLKDAYQQVVGQSKAQQFHEATGVQTAALTDLLQELIDCGHQVHCLEVSSGWMEIHSFNDYKLACRIVAT